VDGGRLAGRSVFAALTGLLPGWRPDLVVSGINPGGNYSSILNHSGTVSAAVAALENGVPALAVSIDGSRAQSEALKDTVAEYTADVVDRLEERLGSKAGQDPGSYTHVRFSNVTGVNGEPGIYALSPGPPTTAPQRWSDWDTVSGGRISIQPIDANRTAGGAVFPSLRYLTKLGF
jgi:5'-nucleotidase